MNRITIENQSGSVLLLCLIILTITTMLVVSSIKQSTLQIRMVGNDINREVAFQTAKSEIIAQYNYILSNGIKENYIDDAVNNIKTIGLVFAVNNDGQYLYDPIILPQKGSFIYSEKTVTTNSKLQYIPSNIRFDHRLFSGGSTGPTKTRTFKLMTSSHQDINIQSIQEIVFDYRVQTGG